MECWEIKDRGFLPVSDPSLGLEGSFFHGSADFSQYICTLENLSSNLSNLLEDRRVREELVFELRSIEGSCHIPPSLSELELERCMLLYSYFASSYVYATYEEPATRIPKEIAIPLVEIARKVKRHPILSYASYCLTNWRRIDIDKPIALGNIELLQHFSTGEYAVDEAWFILVHVDIEAKAAKAVEAIREYPSVSLAGGDIGAILRTIHKSLLEINKTMDRMTEQCRPEVYFNRVRPYIFGFENVVYESCFNDEPQSFRGETGAQSSIVPAVQAALGVKHKQSQLTDHLEVMREYMPDTHREFIAELEQLPSLRDYVEGRPDLYNDYNTCLEQLIRFRKAHLEYAVNYIQKKVTDPKGTGGTPFIPWLSELVRESEEFYL